MNNTIHRYWQKHEDVASEIMQIIADWMFPDCIIAETFWDDSGEICLLVLDLNGIEDCKVADAERCLEKYFGFKFKLSMYTSDEARKLMKEREESNE